MTARPSTAAPILAVLAIVLVMLVAYGGAYLLLGEYKEWCETEPLGEGRCQRTFDRRWHASFFRPAAVAESKLRRIELHLEFRPQLAPE